jgi:hypothetical protein
MEAIGATAVCIQLLSNLGKIILAVQTLVKGVRDIREATIGFEQELEAFQFALLVFSSEVRNPASGSLAVRWFENDLLDRLLRNAEKTFNRLVEIFSDINRQRSRGSRLREYYRTRSYDREVGRLRLHINTYMSALNLPIILLAGYGSLRFLLFFLSMLRNSK